MYSVFAILVSVHAVNIGLQSSMFSQVEPLAESNGGNRDSNRQ